MRKFTEIYYYKYFTIIKFKETIYRDHCFARELAIVIIRIATYRHIAIFVTTCLLQCVGMYSDKP